MPACRVLQPCINFGPSVSLQLKVSAIIEETLHNSLSWRASIGDFLRGRTFTLLLCIQEVQVFETRIKVCAFLPCSDSLAKSTPQMLKESQLRTENNSNPRAIIFLRRRGQDRDQYRVLA
jgi:hypothetical protein